MPLLAPVTSVILTVGVCMADFSYEKQLQLRVRIPRGSGAAAAGFGAHGLSEPKPGRKSRSAEVRRYAELAPMVCLGLAGRFRFSGVLHRFAADQEMRGQPIAGSEPKDDLRHFGRVAILLAPQRMQRLDDRAHGRLVFRKQ